MKRNKLVIIGAGGLGVMTLDAALEMNCYEEIVFVDDNKKIDELIHGYKVIGGIEQLSEIDNEADYIIAIANNRIRKKIAEQYDLNYVNIIHPNTSISRLSKIGIGNIIMPNSTIDPEVVIENHVIINKNNSLGHSAIMENYTQAAPGCKLTGLVKEGSFIGLGGIILTGAIVGSWSTIGAGAVVIKDIPDHATAVGVPAKIIKE